MTNEIISADGFVHKFYERFLNNYITFVMAFSKLTPHRFCDERDTCEQYLCSC